METPKVYAAICNVAAELAKEGISKDRSNQQQGYKFRGIDDVYNALAPIISKNHLVILPRILSRELVERTTAKGGVLFYVTVEAEFDFVSAEDGSKHTVKTYGEAMDSADKATNKAMSAAYKYAAFQTFCIPTEGDNDADAHTPVVAPKIPTKEMKQTSRELTFDQGNNIFTNGATDKQLTMAVQLANKLGDLGDDIIVKHLTLAGVQDMKTPLRYLNSKEASDLIANLKEAGA